MISAFLDRHPERTVRVQGQRWSYFDSEGPGAPVILLGGGQGDASVFFRQFEAFGASARLVAPTYPGDADPGVAVDGLRGFLDALDLQRVHIVGSSLGGYLALALAQASPERIDRLIVACAFADCAPEKRLFPAIEAIMAAPAEALKISTLAKLEAPAPSAAHVALNSALKTAVTRQSAEILKRRTQCILTSPPLAPVTLDADRIALLDCEDDPVITPQTRADLRARLPLARRITLALGGHYPAILAAEQFNALMRLHLGLE